MTPTHAFTTTVHRRIVTLDALNWQLVVGIMKMTIDLLFIAQFTTFFVLLFKPFLTPSLSLAVPLLGALIRSLLVARYQSTREWQSR